MIHRIVLAIVVALGWAVCVRAELKPEEVAVVAARGNRESEALAKYYVRERGIPEGNICLVDVPKTEVMPREMWQWGARPEIQKWLKEHDPNEKLRCLVTVWGVPLKIGPATPDAEFRKYQAFLEGERAHRMKLLEQIREALDAIAPKGELARDDVPTGADRGSAAKAQADAGKSPLFESTENADGKVAGSEPADGPATGGAADESPTKKTTELERLRAALENSLQDAQARLAKLPAGEARNRGQLQLHQLASAAGGANVILQGINQRLSATSEPEANLKMEFDVLRGRMAAIGETKSLLDQMASGIDRDSLALAMMERLTGVIGSVEWLDAQLAVVRQNETGAAFDSELALVMWPDNYQLLRWQPNYLRPGFDNSQLSKVNRTLMVSRIDAPTLPIAKAIIDTSIKVENEGLHGKAYFDNRGIMGLTADNVVPGSYADFDRSLLITAKGIDEMTDMEVVVDATPQLFQPGACPDAALYCGWYSLGKYVDAFDWKPGAVAYHMASSEAVTLRDPGSQMWCKKMLEDGVCATIGPVNEPYLVAFPRPNEFFAMLMNGNLSLVECFYRSQPFNSWMMILIGDPLYRPFKYRATLDAPQGQDNITTGTPTTGTPTTPPTQ